jgi:hypothetical protein
MVSAVNVGSLNMPKMLRHLSHRTSQVREVVFQRDPIYNKEVMTTKDINKDGTRTDALAGPAVSFGYESSDNTTIAGTAANTAYHVSSPRFSFPGLMLLQSPITSRSGRTERGGHRITGACKFYCPSLSYIKNLENFGETTLFDEFETYDKFIDVERIIHNPTNISATADAQVGNHHITTSFTNATAGYEVDRIQFKIKLTDTATTFDSVGLLVTEGGVIKLIRYEGDIPTLTVGKTYTFDYPFREVVNNVPYSQWIDGVEISIDTDVYLSNAGHGNVGGTTIQTDKLYGDSNNELIDLKFTFGASVACEITDIYLYKEAEWRIESIKDYRDEYMQLSAVRVRGERTSRRRAYG